MTSNGSSDIDVKGYFAEQVNDLQDDGFTQHVMNTIHIKEKIRHRFFLVFSLLSILLSGAGLWALDWRFSSLLPVGGANTLLVGTLVVLLAVCLPLTLEE